MHKMSSINLVTGEKPCIDPNATLGIDQACFTIFNLYNTTITFYSIIWEAYLGKGIPQGKLSPKSNASFVVTSKYPVHIYYTANDRQCCHETFSFKEHGSYGWNVSAEDLCSHIYTIREPVDSYLPIFAAFMIYILLIILWSTSKVLYKVMRGMLSPDNVDDDLDRLQEAEASAHPVIRTTKCSTRIRSVDTFRGIAILLMIFVNNSGGEYVFFNHSAWYGLTVADVVLPWFAWIMGLTITISKRAELRVTTSRVKSIIRCFQRSMILILLGLSLNSIHDNCLDNLRFPGVLQLLGVTYFVCASLETIFMKAHSQFGRFSVLRDILDSWPQWLIMIAIVVTHTLITFLLPVPNCPKGYFGPGGFDHKGEYVNCTGGAAGYIDRLIFGNHTYAHTKNPVYGTILRSDPEGLMNTISAILIVYMGVHAGKILLLYYQYNSKIIRWFIWAALTGILAGVLCHFEKQGGVIPLSKKMMTLSFVLAVSSFAFILFAVLYYLIDYKQIWHGSPFVYSGINPIFLYVGHILTKGLYPWAWNITHATHASVLAMNLWTTSLWGIIAYFLYKKDIVITI